MNWWIVKQLRAMVLMDLREFVPINYFEGALDGFGFGGNFEGSEHFSKELAWGYRAGELGRKLFFESTVCMTPRQVAATEVLMNLGMLAGAEAAHGAVKEIAGKAKQNELSGENAEIVAEQLADQYIPAGQDNVKGALEQYCRYLAPNEKEPFMPLLGNLSNDSGFSQEVEFLVRILSNFKVGVRVLADRRHGRPTFVIENEYDVQDLLFVCVRGVFNDARVEEWTPKHAGSSKRVDIVIPSLGVLVETKYVRSRDHARTISGEIKIDIESYHAHPACRSIFVFVYDPNSCLPDPEVLEMDLSGQRVKGKSKFDVQVMVCC